MLDHPNYNINKRNGQTIWDKNHQNFAQIFENTAFRNGIHNSNIFFRIKYDSEQPAIDNVAHIVWNIKNQDCIGYLIFRVGHLSCCTMIAHKKQTVAKKIKVAQIQSKL